jgi:hypothetical protein
MNSQDALGELHARIREKPCDPDKICALLDALSAAERVEVVRGLRGADQSRLYRAVDGWRRVSLTDLVPPAVPALTEVRHYGKNSQLLFALFEKRFYRLPDDDPNAPSELCGANFQSIQLITGPGYFVVHAKPERPNELEVDYRRVPLAKPQGWPAIEPNKWRRGHLFYGAVGFMDTLRRVSEHVTIGSGHNPAIPAYFVLCRQDPLP